MGVVKLIHDSNPPDLRPKCDGAYLDGDDHRGELELHECPYYEIAPRPLCNCCDGCAKMCAADV